MLIERLEQATSGLIAGCDGTYNERVIAIAIAVGVLNDMAQKLIAADELARLLDDIQTHREECFIPGSIGNRRDWDEDAANALAAYRKAGEDNAN
jgi:hypothetical protein